MVHPHSQVTAFILDEGGLIGCIERQEQRAQTYIDIFFVCVGIALTSRSCTMKLKGMFRFGVCTSGAVVKKTVISWCLNPS